MVASLVVMRSGVKQHKKSAVLLSLLISSCCLGEISDQVNPSSAPVESLYTDINSGSCEEVIDPEDPNDTTYQLCPGISGYALIVRRVGSGRRSIDVRNPAGEEFPLDYQEYITRHMSHLGDKAEWRVRKEDGGKIPIALIVRVHSQENEDEPGEVTHLYLAVAKITPTEICVTGRILEGTQRRATLRRATDMAQGKECLEPQPQLVVE